MHLSLPIIDRPSPCSYLPDRNSRLEYRLAFDLSAAEYAELGCSRAGDISAEPCSARAAELHGLSVDPD